MSTSSAPKVLRLFALNRLVLLMAVSSVAILTSGCIQEDDLTADQRAYQLSQQLMCPVCDGQTLDQSQAQLSVDMKAVIQTKIEEGETNAEIRDYFVERYGEIVLASPDAGGFNIIVWIVPAVIFLGGSLLVGNAYLSMKRRKRQDGTNVEPASAASTGTGRVSTDAELDEYLERADREMASVLGRSPESDQSSDGSEGRT